MPRLKRLALLIFTSTLARILGAFILISASVAGVQKLLKPLRWPDDAPLTTSALALHALGAAVIITVCLGLYALFVRLTERRWPSELRPANLPLEFSLGAALGLALSAASVGLLWLCNLYHVEAIAPREDWPALLARGAVANTVVAVLEETLFRAVLFRLIQRRLGSWWALAISSVFFGFAHAFNPNASLASSLAIAVEAGILLGAVYILTQRLWLAVGLHAAWNFMQESIVGGALSGSKVHAILDARLSDPAWLSGGAFGLEASPIAAALCTAAGLAALHLARRRRKLLPRTWPTSPPSPPSRRRSVAPPPPTPAAHTPGTSSPPPPASPA